MAKHLHHITEPIKSYISQSHAHISLKKQLKQDKNATLPPALQLAIIRGKAHADIACFSFFAHKHFDDAFIYQAYTKIYEDSHAIMDFVQHCGVISETEDYIVHGIANQTIDYQSTCQHLFYLLIDHLHQHNHKLFVIATTGFIQHYFPSFYPKNTSLKPNLEQLKKQLQKLVNQKLHKKVQIKESFTADEMVDFALLLKVQGYYDYELVRIEAKRVRNARFQAYHQAIKLLQADETKLQLHAKTAKKSQPMKPIG